MEPVVSVPDKKKNKGGGTRSGLQMLGNAVSSVLGVDTTSAVLQGVGAGAHTDDLGEGSTLREEVGEGYGSDPEHLFEEGGAPQTSSIDRLSSTVGETPGEAGSTCPDGSAEGLGKP